MADKSTFAIGFLETWIEKVGKEFSLVVAQPLEHLKTVEKALAYLRGELQKHTQEVIGASDAGLTRIAAQSHVTLDWRGDPQDTKTFGRAFVCFSNHDGSIDEPGAAFQNGTEPCFQMWPIPRPYTFTLTDLKELVKLMEDNGARLPYEEV